MEQFYNILKESLNEEMGWMIDHIYEAVRKYYVYTLVQTFMSSLKIYLYMFYMFILAMMKTR